MKKTLKLMSLFFAASLFIFSACGPDPDPPVVPPIIVDPPDPPVDPPVDPPAKNGTIKVEFTTGYDMDFNETKLSTHNWDANWTLGEIGYLEGDTVKEESKFMLAFSKRNKGINTYDDFQKAIDSIGKLEGLSFKERQEILNNTLFPLVKIYGFFTEKYVGKETGSPSTSTMIVDYADSSGVKSIGSNGVHFSGDWTSYPEYKPCVLAIYDMNLKDLTFSASLTSYMFWSLGLMSGTASPEILPKAILKIEIKKVKLTSIKDPFWYYMLR